MICFERWNCAKEETERSPLGGHGDTKDGTVLESELAWEAVEATGLGVLERLGTPSHTV